MTNEELYEKAAKVIQSVTSRKQAQSAVNYFFLADNKLPENSIYRDMLWRTLQVKLNQLMMGNVLSWMIRS